MVDRADVAGSFPFYQDPSLLLQQQTLTTPLLEGMEQLIPPGSHSKYPNKNIYNQDRLKYCPICPYTSPKLSHIKRHMLSHTGEKPFACHLCTHRCNDKGNLHKHITSHNNNKKKGQSTTTSTATSTKTD